MCSPADPFLCIFRVYIQSKPDSNTSSDYAGPSDRINFNPDQKLCLQPGYAYHQDRYHRHLDKPGQHTSPDRFRLRFIGLVLFRSTFERRILPGYVYCSGHVLLPLRNSSLYERHDRRTVLTRLFFLFFFYKKRQSIKNAKMP